MSTIIGIDLGTTNSVCSIIERGEPRIVINEEGGRTTPSVVGFAKNDDLLHARRRGGASGAALHDDLAQRERPRARRPLGRQRRAQPRETCRPLGIERELHPRQGPRQAVEIAEDVAARAAGLTVAGGDAGVVEEAAPEGDVRRLRVVE